VKDDSFNALWDALVKPVKDTEYEDDGTSRHLSEKMKEANKNGEALSECAGPVLERIVKEHRLAVDGLTEKQFVEALEQALPDFTKHVLDRKQQVVYIPGLEARKWKDLYHELLWAVEEKYPDETRHETALRLIKTSRQQTPEQENQKV
jgi:hypothetical protein